MLTHKCFLHVTMSLAVNNSSTFRYDGLRDRVDTSQFFGFSSGLLSAFGAASCSGCALGVALGLAFGAVSRSGSAFDATLAFSAMRARKTSQRSRSCINWRESSAFASVRPHRRIPPLDTHATL
jgi:hypothetical protein